MQQTNPEVDEYGTRRWYQDDQLHRLDGPAVEYAGGAKWWYKHDQLHRVDGPAAVTSTGHRYWYRNGLCHRLDGPAVVTSIGKRWYINGDEYTEDEFRLFLFVNS